MFILVLSIYDAGIMPLQITGVQAVQSTEDCDDGELTGVGLYGKSFNLVNIAALYLLDFAILQVQNHGFYDSVVGT